MWEWSKAGTEQNHLHDNLLFNVGPGMQLGLANDRQSLYQQALSLAWTLLDEEGAGDRRILFSFSRDLRGSQKRWEGAHTRGPSFLY